MLLNRDCTLQCICQYGPSAESLPWGQHRQMAATHQHRHLQLCRVWASWPAAGVPATSARMTTHVKARQEACMHGPLMYTCTGGFSFCHRSMHAGQVYGLGAQGVAPALCQQLQAVG